MLKIVLPVALVILIVLVAVVAAGIYFYNSTLEHSSIFNNPTSTIVVCVPSTISRGQSTSCAARVTDTSSTKTFVTGNVSFTPTGSCHLAGFGPMETCYVSISSRTSGALTVTARYAGDSSHTPSSGSTVVTVR